MQFPAMFNLCWTNFTRCNFSCNRDKLLQVVAVCNMPSCNLCHNIFGLAMNAQSKLVLHEVIFSQLILQRSKKRSTASCRRHVKLQLHDAIYRLRFYSNSLTHILSLLNSHNDVASTQKTRGDKSQSVIIALHDAMTSCNL